MYLILICLVTFSASGVLATSLTLTPTIPTPIENRTLSSSLSNSSTARTNVSETGKGWQLPVDSDAAMRTFYVVAFAMATVVIYFVIRAVRLRRRKSKSRKYGVITSTSALEMEPLEKGEDDDDEDTTLFEVHHHNKYGQK